MRNCLLMLAIAALFAGPAGAEAYPTMQSVVRADSRSGRLVRRVVVQPKAIAPKVVRPIVVDENAAAADSRRTVENPPPDAAVEDLIDHAARKYNVDANLVHAVVKVESNYDRFAVSHAGAEGLMQLVPATARRFGVSNAFDARQNIEAGVRYLKYLQTLYSGNMRLALAAYNAGEGAVGKFQGIPRYRETESYVLQVGRRWGELNRGRKPVEPKQVAPAPQPASAKTEGEHPPLETVVDADGRIHLRTR
jgi:soluble lytic murein transglycosylase-like protein